MAEGPTHIIADPSGRSAGRLAVIVDPEYRSDQSRELGDALRHGIEDSTSELGQAKRDGRLASGVTPETRKD